MTGSFGLDPTERQPVLEMVPGWPNVRFHDASVTKRRGTEHAPGGQLRAFAGAAALDARRSACYDSSMCWKGQQRLCRGMPRSRFDPLLPPTGTKGLTKRPPAR